jgi:hypothetical protein
MTREATGAVPIAGGEFIDLELRSYSWSNLGDDAGGCANLEAAIIGRL